MNAIRWAHFACPGSVSEIRMPETFVSRTPYGPRTSVGASGFGSYVSCWLAPPSSQIRITAVCFFGFAVAALASRRRQRSARVSPAAPRHPA